jgi:hypothetical protein
MSKRQGSFGELFFWDFFHSFVSPWVIVWIAFGLFIAFYGWSHGGWIVAPALLVTLVITNRTARTPAVGLLVVLGALILLFELCKATGVIQVQSNCIPFTGICPSSAPTATPHATPHATPKKP